MHSASPACTRLFACVSNANARHRGWCLGRSRRIEMLTRRGDPWAAFGDHGSFGTRDRTHFLHWFIECPHRPHPANGQSSLDKAASRRRSAQPQRQPCASHRVRRRIVGGLCADCFLRQSRCPPCDKFLICDVACRAASLPLVVRCFRQQRGQG